jgi:hypothetical protein
MLINFRQKFSGSGMDTSGWNIGVYKGHLKLEEIEELSGFYSYCSGEPGEFFAGFVHFKHITDRDGKKTVVSQFFGYDV